MKRILIFLTILTISCNVKAQDEIGVWEISNGVFKADSLKNNLLGEKYYETIYSILPIEMLNKYVVSLRLFSDGKDEDLGGLNQIEESVEFWQIDLDTADVNLFTNDSIKILDYTHTLIHEFGHLLTLNTTQIELTNDKYENSNFGYLTAEGYAKKNSYLGKFVAKFWNSNLLWKWDRIDKKRNETKRIDLLYEFYLTYSDKFVTDYAAESPEEDIAESWTFFVLSDKLTKSTIKYQKINFFYQFPELIKYRNKIKSKIKFVPIRYIENFPPAMD